MRTSKLLSRVVLLCGVWLGVNAQVLKKQASRPPVSRCSTMEILDKIIKDDPSLPEKWRAEGERRYKAAMQARQGSTNRMQAGEIIIPVVFHLVGTAADQAAIPDRDAYEQIEILNRDYYGQKAAAYAGLFPQSIANTIGRATTIKFVLARRTPAGALTSGIERRVTTQTFSSTTLSALKHTNTGGLDAWNPDGYFNVWGCNFSDGLLGSAFFPYMTPASEQGVAIGLYTLGANTCRGYYPNYNQGATLSHEAGHYFYLYHTFNDANGCNNRDFRLEPGFTLPAAAVADDTPPEFADNAGTTLFGNVSQNYNDGCAGPDGIAYGSFMNYYDDRSLFMFTEGHRQRVLATLNLYRTGFTTASIGATPPGTVTDAYLVNVSPYGRCDTRMPAVPGTPITVTVRNFGTSPLTSVAMNVRIDAAAAVATTIPLSLAAGADTTLTVGSTPAATGNHTIVVYTTAPNGGADAFLSNDTLTTLISTRTVTITAPFTESFTATTFPPANWVVNNGNTGSFTWGRNTTAGFTAAGAAVVRNAFYDGSGQLDELTTPPIDFGLNDSAVLSFKVAHADYSNATAEWDGLEIHLSADGGKTYRMIWKKTGNFLRTVADPVSTEEFNPLLDQTKWRNETLNLTSYLVQGQRMIIKFRNTTAYGNNTYLDDINVTAALTVPRDILPIAFVNLPAYVCPGFNLPTPAVTVLSAGTDTIRSFSLNYQIDNGQVTTVAATTRLGRRQAANFTLGTLNLGAIAPGTHTLKVYTSQPNGLADQAPANDTLVGSFIVYTRQAAPLVEGFEGTTFPPAGWIVRNADAAITWAKTDTAGRSSRSSALLNNYSYAGNGAIDDLQTPILTYSNTIDSLSLAFDVAAATYSYPGSTAVPLDTLEVLATVDCGTTYTSVYKKWGNTLQTINDPNYPQTSRFIPLSGNQWRNEFINLTAFKNAGSLQVVFRNTNHNENNIFVDNINLSTKTLPAKLKEQGYLIYPSPFSTSFYVQHYLPPTELRGIAVYNAIGQQVWAREYNAAGAPSLLPVDLSRFASGVYTVVLRYTNRTLNQKVLKAN